MMNTLLRICLLSFLYLVSVCAQAQAQSEVQPNIYPTWLPPAAQVKNTLENLPQLRASRSNLIAEKAT